MEASKQEKRDAAMLGFAVLGTILWWRSKSKKKALLNPYSQSRPNYQSGFGGGQPARTKRSGRKTQRQNPWDEMTPAS